MVGVSVWLGSQLFDTCCSGAVLPWSCIRSAICEHAWVELYGGQKDEWVQRMDDPSNLSSRVWFTFCEQVIELKYERYFENTYHVREHATFVIISDFDNFITFCPGATRERSLNNGQDSSCLGLL